MNKNMNIFYRFFCWAGGGNTEVLRGMPTEQNRFFAYGAVITATSFFAFLSSSYAFTLLLGEEIGDWAFMPAIAWALFIFLLDRFFIVSISNRGSFLTKLKMASPRIVLAIFIGIIISKPLEYRIFKREILDDLRVTVSKEVEKLDTLQRQKTTKLNKDKQTKIDLLPGWKEMEPLTERITDLKADVANKNTDMKAQEDSAQREFAGLGLTRTRGIGPAYLLHIARRDTLARDIHQLNADITSTQGKIDAIRTKLKEEIEGPIAAEYKKREDALGKEILAQQKEMRDNYTPSILNQEMALSNIGKGNSTAALTVLFVTILFIFIELAPILLKLMTSAGAYENRIAQIEATYNTEDRLRRSLDMEEYKSNRGLVRGLARSQRDIIHSAMNGWHAQQMNKMEDDPDHFNDMFNNNHDNGNYTGV